MSKLKEALESSDFVVTSELNPPKGTRLASLFEKAELLKSAVTAFNLTDSHRSRMTMSPLAVAHLLVERAVEPILQVTCRDRKSPRAWAPSPAIRSCLGGIHYAAVG